MVRGNDAAKALDASNSRIEKPIDHPPLIMTAHGKSSQIPHGEAGVVDNTHSQRTDDLTSTFRHIKENQSLECVVPTRTLSRTMSPIGREAMLNRFRQRRSVQRQALIDRILEGLEPAEVKAVHRVNKRRKQFERLGIDQLRVIWKGQALWLATKPDRLSVSESTEGVWQESQRAEEAQCVSPDPIDKYAEDLAGPTESGPCDPSQSWGSDGAVWSPGHREEWGGYGDEPDLMGGPEENDREHQDQQLEKDARSPRRHTGDENVEEPDDEHDEEEEDKQDEDDRLTINLEEPKGLSVVTFEYPAWYADQCRDGMAVKLKTQTTGTVFKRSREANDTANADSTVCTQELASFSKPILRPHDNTVAPPSPRFSAQSLPVRLFEQSPSSDGHHSADAHFADQHHRSKDVNVSESTWLRDAAEYLHYPGPSPLLILPKPDMPGEMKLFQGTNGKNEEEQYISDVTQDQTPPTGVSQANPHGTRSPPSTTPSSSPRVSSPTASNETALSLEVFAEKVFPFVLDKDGYLFECLLSDSVKVMDSRASNRWKMRDRPKLPGSGLRKAWTIGIAVLDEVDSNGA